MGLFHRSNEVSLVPYWIASISDFLTDVSPYLLAGCWGFLAAKTRIMPSTAAAGDSVNTSTAGAIVSKADATLAADSVSLTRQGNNEEITRKLKQVLARLNLSQEQKGQLESYHTKRERIAELSDQKVSSMCESKYP